jgi:hypothetical protein
MWPVSPPAAAVAEVARLSAQRVRDGDFASKIRASIPKLNENHEQLRNTLAAREMHGVDPSTFDVPELHDEQLRTLYDQQLAHPKGAARSIYDQLLGGARFDLCSYCQHAQATTLDHFLPKSWIAGLAIEPWNLVPSCQQCNKKLLSFRAVREEQSLFHPYEEWVDERWLFAEALEGDPTALRFEARPPGSLNELTRKRIISQFQTLGLALMYGAVSGRDVAEARAGIERSTYAARIASQDAALTLAPELVSEHLQTVSADAFAVDPNSRKGAAYEALAANQRFCSIPVVAE